MRISVIISLAKQYLFLGIIIAFAIMIVFSIIYTFFYKKKGLKPKKLPIYKTLLYMILISYLFLVLGATLFNRTNGLNGFNYNMQLHFLYSYHEAWNHWSFTEWRNIILNIFLLIPFGFLLPLTIRRFQTSFYTYLASFIFTISIELIQLLSGRGVFDIDDIFNNFLGALIGYGIYRFIALLLKRNKKEFLLSTFLYQTPLFITIGTGLIILITYHNQELGNLNSDYIYQLSNITISSNNTYLETETKVPVYQLHIANKKETTKQAEEFFALLGLNLDSTRNIFYDNTAFYYSNNGHSLQIEYAGNAYTYTDFNELFNENKKVKENASEEELKTALKKYNITLPEGTSFINQGNGEYLFSADQILDNDILYSGTLRCTYMENNVIASIYQNIIAYKFYRTFPIISKQKAYHKIEQGKFNYYTNSKEPLNIKVNHITLSYETDSKGFYQPVYAFDATINNKETNIFIPALK